MKAYETTFAHFRQCGQVPTVQRLDNETSGALKKYFLQQQVAVQFVPAHNHRANRAERAIRDFKNHFIATLGTVHPSFPLNLWDEILQQVNIVINLLHRGHPSRHLRAYTAISTTFSHTPWRRAARKS